MKLFGQLSKGGAVWTATLFEKQDDWMSVRREVGEITGEEMLAGCDVDNLLENLWASLKTPCRYLEMNLMLASGKVVRIASSFDRNGSKVLKVEFDRTTFPSGLKGRWVDVVFEKEPVSGKEGKKRRSRAG
jgi:hypothetical protein